MGSQFLDILEKGPKGMGNVGKMIGMVTFGRDSDEDANLVLFVRLKGTSV